MTTYAILLRAINVGGRNKILMAELRELLAELKFANVETYIQSGNIVCTSAKKSASVEKAVKVAIADRFGHDIDVMVRTAAEIQQVVDTFPYQDPDPKASGVMFMAHPVDAEIDATKFAPDELQVAGAHIFMNYAVSFSDSKLTPSWVEKQAGCAGTRRNWATVLKLADMMSSN